MLLINAVCFSLQRGLFENFFLPYIYNDQHHITATAIIANAYIAIIFLTCNYLDMNEQNKTTADQKLASEIKKTSTGWLIKSLGVWLDKQMDIRLAPLGLSKGQFAIIMTLLENEGVTQAEIGRKILMPGYATTRNIDKLELDKLLKRQRHKSSRRAHSIYLTEKGRALAPTLLSIVNDVNSVFLESIDDKNRKELTGILSMLHDNLVVNL